MHVLFNVAAVRCLRLTALNRERTRILLRRFRWHRAAARAAEAARLVDDDHHHHQHHEKKSSKSGGAVTFRRFPNAVGVVGEGVLTPAQVAPLETLLPSQFSWVLSPFVWVVTMCQPSRWPFSRMGMRWYKRRLANRVGEGAGIRMGARLSALAEVDAAHVIARATASSSTLSLSGDAGAGAGSGDASSSSTQTPYVVLAGGAGTPAKKITAPAGQWSTGAGKGALASVVLSRSAG